MPITLTRIVVRMSVAGRVYRKTLPPEPHQKVKFTWDGLDYRGIPVVGKAIARIDVGFVYDAVYYTPAEFIRAFGVSGIGRGGGGGGGGGSGLGGFGITS